MHARYFAPELGRFLQTDPSAISYNLRAPQSWNRYVYVLNNPLLYIDPLGLYGAPSECDPNSCMIVRDDFIPASLIDFQSFWFNLVTGGLDWFSSDLFPDWIFDPANPIDYAAVFLPWAKWTDELWSALKSSGQLNRFVAEWILAAARKGAALADNLYHRAASYLTRDQLAAGQVFRFTGGDGVERTLLQTPGEFNGVSGIFEYIIDTDGLISHQTFIPNGTITGTPNQWP